MMLGIEYSPCYHCDKTKCSFCELTRYKDLQQKKEGGEVKQKKKKRKYYRKCGICGERHEQSDMIRTNESPNGWICFDCHNAEHPEYDIDEW